MTATANGEVIATGTRTDCGWHVTTWPRPLPQRSDHSLMLAERLATHSENDPCVIEWRTELVHD